MSFEKEENFYKTLSNEEDQLENKFEKMEVTEQEHKETKVEKN